MLNVLQYCIGRLQRYIILVLSAVYTRNYKCIFVQRTYLETFHIEACFGILSNFETAMWGFFFPQQISDLFVINLQHAEEHL